jgi:drug/metabolite transporter (DMT)-like permease
MPPEALALALGAAFLHATWNLTLARARDTHAAIGIAMLIGGIALLPIALLRWRIEPEALPYLAASCVAELVYFALLATAYGRSGLSLTYAIARGSAPVLVLIGGFVVLGIEITPWQAGGVVLVGIGVLLVRGLRAPAAIADVGLALLIALVIATYTLLDREGVRHADPFAYASILLIVPGGAYLLVLARRGGRVRLGAALTPSIAYGGVAAGATYTAVLFALTLAPPASVTAVRESSIVMATALAAVILRESVSSSRWLGSLVVVAGVALVAASP